MTLVGFGAALEPAFRDDFKRWWNRLRARRLRDS
jgi:hypothetical protein